MKGSNHIGFITKSRSIGMASPQRVQSGGSIKGSISNVASKKTNMTAGFTASRKKGYIKGSC